MSKLPFRQMTEAETHVLDGLHYYESELRIEEHYADTTGFTDHVFALCHLLGFPSGAMDFLRGMMESAPSSS